MLHASTGAGKTYALWFAALNRFAITRPPATGKRKPPAEPLSVLWITPMRALAADSARALQAPLEALQIPWSVGLRTGDTSSERARQTRRQPTALVTTPESLTLMLARADSETSLAHLRMVIVDEWHELIGNKRGVQLQLALARLRRWHPQLMVWGISATLGNQAHALEVLVPQGGGVNVQGQTAKALKVDTLLPAVTERFPWAGHIGLKMLPQVVNEVEASSSCLVFTNTRAQSEIWYQAILDARPDWASLIALHHGSLSRETRDWVERALKEAAQGGGVHLQPRPGRGLPAGGTGAANRLRQGRSAVDATRRAFRPRARAALTGNPGANPQPRVGGGGGRPGCNRPTAHRSAGITLQAVGCAGTTPGQHGPGGSFTPAALLDEVRGAWAYRDLTEADWAWALGFVRHGGLSLTAYPDYRRVEPDEQGIWRVPDARLARRHRMSVGTIVSDASIQLKFWSKGGGGRTWAVSRKALLQGSSRGWVSVCRTLAGAGACGKHDRLCTPQHREKAAVPRWNGGRMPLSTNWPRRWSSVLMPPRMGTSTARNAGGATAAAHQLRWSGLPTREHLLAETLRSREGWHLFLYPFAGRQVHLGLASLLAWRVSQQQPLTFSIAVNDYGLELLSATEVQWPRLLNTQLLSPKTCWLT